MLTPEQFEKLLKLTLQHDNHIDILFGITNDFACLIEQTLERCSRDNCKSAATVRHSEFGVVMCDHCAATTMIRARENIRQNLTDVLIIQTLRLAMMSEDLWVDLPNAERIRKVTGYVEHLTKNDEPVPPQDPTELH